MKTLDAKGLDAKGLDAWAEVVVVDELRYVDVFRTAQRF